MLVLKKYIMALTPMPLTPSDNQNFPKELTIGNPCPWYCYIQLSMGMI